MIPSFYGCVQDGDVIYLIQEFTTSSLESSKFINLYPSFTGRQKSDLMIQIASKFEALHNKKIVHGNIQLASLFTRGIVFDDIRIANFEYANKEGSINPRKDSYFVSPVETENRVLSYEGDVYALAVTFSMMEKPMYGFFCKLNMEGKINNPLLNEDLENFRSAVASSFNKKAETEHLAEVIARAINQDPSK